MEQPLVSVIVPVYNAGEHIARCIESIRRQSYQNLEIIIVNDGSKDVSLHVCEMYARVDKRILLIDEILTTGATLREAARVLREAGAERVICATLAAADED